MPSNLGFCCFCSYACLLTSDYLKCLLPSIYLIGACLPIIPVDSGLLRVQLSLWSFDCGILWTWDSGCVRVFGSQASSETLKYWCDPAPLILGSCCPKILSVLQCLEVVSPLRTMELSGLFETKVHQNRSKVTWASGQKGLWCPCSCCHNWIGTEVCTSKTYFLSSLAISWAETKTPALLYYEFKFLRHMYKYA